MYYHQAVLIAETRRLLQLYPRIFLACHLEHVHDPKTRNVLSAHQASLLDHLDETEPMGLVDLARHLGVTASTMSIHIDRLARKGYVRRIQDKTDGRRINLTLTKDGSRIKEAQKVLDPALVSAMLARLSSREREEGLKGLALLSRAAEGMLKLRSEKGLKGRIGRLQKGGITK